MNLLYYTALPHYTYNTARPFYRGIQLLGVGGERRNEWTGIALHNNILRVVVNRFNYCRLFNGVRPPKNILIITTATTEMVT